MEEVPLTGGRVTADVVRVGDTVRRPLRANSRLVRALLEHLEERAFDAAPRYLGPDERGRETFGFVRGEVPADLDPAIPDETLAAAARLVRRFHDATAGTALAADREVVCHNDLSPCNFVFRAGVPVAIVDFDAAAPGERLRDLATAIFLWLNLGADGQGLAEQARRIRLFSRAYGIEANREVVDAVVAAVGANVEQLRAEDRLADAEWWREQLDWLDQRRDELVQELRASSPG